jgi:uncharacterized protein YukE
MSGKLNLTPEALSSIISTMENMKNSLISEASQLERDTMSIKSKWDDDQYEVFESTMINFDKQLKMMADHLDREKERIIRYQRESMTTRQNYGNS